MKEDIDYKRLLKIYMSKVIDIESVDFIDISSYEIDICEEDRKILKVVSEEIYKEWNN